jgi:hypothetical protein
MFTTTGEQEEEPRIRSDDAPTVKKRRSRRKLALSSVSRAFSRSSPLASPAVKHLQDLDTSPAVFPSSPSTEHFESSGYSTPPAHSHGGSRNAWRSASNPALARVHTFDPALMPGLTLSTGDEITEPGPSGNSRSPILPTADDELQGSVDVRRRGKGRVVSTSAHLDTLRNSPLRSSTSIPNLGAGHTRYFSGQTRSRPPPVPDRFHEEDVRTSFRSALTFGSSVDVASGTERSSIMTSSSSVSDFFADPAKKPAIEDQEMSVEDAVSMYIDGFQDGSDIHRVESFVLTAEDEQRRSMRLAEAMNDSIGDPDQVVLFEASPSTDLRYLDGTSHNILHNNRDSFNLPPPTVTSGSALRDRYGFKKTTQYISLAQYDLWDSKYSEYLTHRRPKWEQFLKEHGLSPTDPIRFPPKGPKGKRYVRKGIPPEYRGAAWFWYSGAYTQLHRNPGLYQKLVRDSEAGKLSLVDYEHIERDLNRTFPDNINFKPDPSGRTSLPLKNPQSEPQDTPIIKSLRRLLCAFALHNPKTGYCQSLNFLAGLLLLFLPEERAFWTLQVLTSSYLPGAHEISLEGANIDLWVFMTLLKDTMPSIYAKTLTAGSNSISPSTNPIRLPPITLCLTSWLMSLFIGSLPIETTLRVWDIFFYEGSRTFFRIALAIFKAGEKQIMAVTDPMETFQVVQTIPRRLLDVDNLIEGCYRRRGGFGNVSQERIEELRVKRRDIYQKEKERISSESRRRDCDDGKKSGDLRT